MTNNMSFYGGRPGKSFVITKIFDNFIDLQNDADQGWVSVIPVGDYVIVGNNKIEETKENSSTQNTAYNGTLWQKIYMEFKEGLDYEKADSDLNTYIINDRTHYFAFGEKYGIGYKFVSETGNTPEINIQHTTLPPNEKPVIKTIGKGRSGATYEFNLPRSSNYYYFEYIENISLIDTNNKVVTNIGVNTSTKIVLDENSFISNINYNNYIGDYFIEKNVGLVYKLEGTNDNDLKLVFKTKLTTTPETIINNLTYANEENKLNQPNVKSIISEKDNGSFSNGYEFQLPNNPDIDFNINFKSSLEASVDKNIYTDGINYTINFPAGLKGISNFNIKYIVDTFTNLPSKENTTELEFADLALVGQNGSFTLYIYTNNEWQQLSQLNEINFVTGNSLGEIKQSVVTDGEENNELNYYNIKVMNDMLSWNGNVEQPKFLSVKEGNVIPNEIPGQLYVNTETKELYYEGKPITQETLSELNVNSFNPINSSAVSHLEGGQFNFNIPNNLKWIQDQQDKKLWTSTLVLNKDVVYKWLQLSSNKVPLITFVEDVDYNVNLDRQQQFDKINYIDINYNPNVQDEINITIGLYTENQQFPITQERAGLPIRCILPGGKGVEI